MIRSIFLVFPLLLLVDAAAARDERSIKDLRNALVALAPDVDPGEAELTSVTAHTTARSLKGKYRVVLNPEFQCFLINIGLRQRGYCGHWTRDIGEVLKELKLKTLVLHWGVEPAFPGGNHHRWLAQGRPIVLGQSYERR